ncbi:MAG TPA: lysophospholipid acyltransferase family protein [Bryobacteraceae bacterium]|nr:lysophospholipid acyltransferase family protein [Bryobacteraceae bacterium]
MSFGYLWSVLVKAPLIAVATVLYGSVSLLFSFFDRTGRRQMDVARAWARVLLRIGGVEVVVEGLEKITPELGYVFISNHASYMDTPVVLAHIPAQFRFLAKEDLFRIPFLGTHLKRGGHFPVPKDNPREALKTLAEAGRAIREHNVSVLIFPEGGRSLDGLQPFKEGAAMLGIKAGVPIVPIGLHGTLEVLPMHSAHLKSGRVVLRIGDPIGTEGYRPSDRERLTNELRERVATLLEGSTTLF